MTNSPIEQQLRKELADVFDSITTGMYLSEDGETFSPIRWEDSPMRPKYIDDLTALFDTYAARRADEARAEMKSKLLNEQLLYYQHVTEINPDTKTEWAVSTAEIEEVFEEVFNHKEPNV